MKILQKIKKIFNDKNMELDIERNETEKSFIISRFRTIIKEPGAPIVTSAIDRKYKKTDSSKNFKLANIVFEYVNFGLKPKTDYKDLMDLEREIIKCGDRTNLLLRIIELISTPSNCEELGLVGKTYFYLGASYRLEGIEKYAIKQIKCGLYGDELLNYSKMLEGEYMFSEAVDIYLDLIEGGPSFAGYYSSLARVMVKQNKLDDAIELLELAKNSKYYEPYFDKYQLNQMNTDFKEVIDRELEDAKSKKERGYVYRPRNKKK